MINKFWKALPMAVVVFLLSFLSVFGRNTVLSEGFVLLAYVPFIILGVYVLYEYISNRKLNSSLFIWMIFSLSVLIAELQNGNVVDSLFLISIPYVFLYFNKSMEDSVRSLVLGTLPLIIAALAATLMNDRFTSNTIGIIVSSFLISFNVLQLFNKKFNLIKSIYIVVVNFVVLYIMMFINSRTSLLIVLMAYAITAIHIFYINRKAIIKLLTKSKYRNLFRILLATLVIALGYAAFEVLQQILTPKWRPDDISTGRFDIWATTIKNSTLFGHSYDWYSTSGLFGTHKGPHNMFIGILGFSGAISLVIFLAFIAVHIKKLVSVYLKKPTSVNIAVIILLITSLTKGLTESLIIQSFYQIYNFFFIFSIAFGFKDINKGIKFSKINSSFVKLMYIWLVLFLLLANFGSVLNFDFDLISSFIGKFI